MRIAQRGYTGPVIPPLDPLESPSVLGGIGAAAVWIGPAGADGTGASYLGLGYTGPAGAGGQAAWNQTDFVGSVAISAEDVHGNLVSTWLEVDASSEDDVLTLVDVGAGVLMPQWAPAAAGAYLPLAGGTMTGPILGAVGSAALPGYSFGGDPDTGIYRPAANVIGLSVAGVEVARVRAGGAGGLSVSGSGTSFGTVESFRVNTPATNINTANAIFTAGAATHVPLHAQGAAAQSGFLISASNSAGVGLAGIDSAGRVHAADGVIGTPGFVFISDTDTGIYRPTTNVIAITAGGNEAVRFDTNRRIIAGGAGSAAAPEFTVTSDTDTGIYWSAADTLDVTTGGARIASFTADQLLLDAGGPSAPAFSFIADPATGIYRQAANTLGFAAAGALVAQVEAGRFTVLEDCVLGTGSSDIGFYGVGPVAQDVPGGVTAGFTAGAGNQVLHDSTFTGDIGTAAYTLGDIVAALKSVGLISAS